jgi:hypothetical protein
MSLRVALFFISVGLILPCIAGATQRTLTDTQGRSIDVVLLGKTDSGILVTRADGAEFEISYDLLSQTDREFLSQWQPPKPETPENAIDAVVVINTETSSGTGFFAHDSGKTYLYTNQHVISDIQNVKAKDSKGNLVKLGFLEISNSQDVARFQISQRPALLITDSIESNEAVTVLGNSEGSGVITTGKGKIKGIGATELEVDTDFVPGNSGGPVINSENKVVGIATYILRGDEKPDWVTKDTRYSKPRRFTIRPSRVEDWRKISREEYAKQVGDLNNALRLFDQAYWSYRMLDEGKGYLSNLPNNWHRDILQILRNHNSRQKRPDATRTNYYQGGYYVGSTTESHAEKKEASRRANLRALMRVIDDEFGDLYNLKNRQLDIKYLLNNDYGSAKVLEAWLNELRTEMNNEMGFSKGSF